MVRADHFGTHDRAGPSCDGLPIQQGIAGKNNVPIVEDLTDTAWCVAGSMYHRRPAGCVE